jgi:glycosyltransferase involved in cell wall biosynthesis
MFASEENLSRQPSSADAMISNGKISSTGVNGEQRREPSDAQTGESEAIPAVSIVIPVYNSERTIERLCLALIDGLAKEWPLQIVLVDDGSQDNSAAVCRKLHEKYAHHVCCVLLSKNFGEHNAVMAGLNCATGDYCVVMDDDFQNPPHEVERMLREIEKGYDVVYARYQQKKHSLWRNLGSRLHNRMATHALGKPKDLYLSSFKAMSRFAVQELVKYRGPDPYLDAILLRTTRNIGVLDVSHEAREEGASGYTLMKLFGLWGNMIVAFSIYPLRLIALYGLITTLSGVAYACYKLIEWWSPGMPDPDPYEKLNASMWVFRGSSLLAIGIVGEYVGRIYRNLSSTPQYVIRNQFRCKPREGGHAPQKARMEE